MFTSVSSPDTKLGSFREIPCSTPATDSISLFSLDRKLGSFCEIPCSTPATDSISLFSLDRKLGSLCANPSSTAVADSISLFSLDRKLGSFCANPCSTAATDLVDDPTERAALTDLPALLARYTLTRSSTVRCNARWHFDSYFRSSSPFLLSSNASTVGADAASRSSRCRCAVGF